MPLFHTPNSYSEYDNIQSTHQHLSLSMLWKPGPWKVITSETKSWSRLCIVISLAHFSVLSVNQNLELLSRSSQDLLLWHSEEQKGSHYKTGRFPSIITQRSGLKCYFISSIRLGEGMHNITHLSFLTNKNFWLWHLKTMSDSKYPVVIVKKAQLP